MSKPNNAKAACIAAVAFDPRVTVQSRRADYLSGTITLSPGDLEQIAINLGTPRMVQGDTWEVAFEIVADDDESWTVTVDDFWERDARMWPADVVTQLEFGCLEYLEWSQARRFTDEAHPLPRN